MTRSGPPPESEVPDPTVSALHAHYRDAARDEPGPMLDRTILDAARAELLAAEAKNSRRPTRWWQGWLPAASAIAAVLVGLSITWRVMDEQERRVRDEMGAAQTAGESAAGAASAERPAPAGAANETQVSAAQKSSRTESAADRDASIGVPEPAVKPAPAAPAPTLPVAEGAAPKSRSGGTDEARERRDGAAAMGAASSPPPREETREAGRLGADFARETAADSLARPAAAPAAKALGGAVAVPASDAATPEAWLQQIRELRAAGRGAEAAQSLARFRARYPDFALPEDVLNLK